MLENNIKEHTVLQSRDTTAYISPVYTRQLSAVEQPYISCTVCAFYAAYTRVARYIYYTEKKEAGTEIRVGGNIIVRRYV